MTRSHVTALAAEHTPQYRELMLHAYRHAPDAFVATPEEREAEPLAWWARRIADPKGASVAFGAFLGEELVGTVALEFSSRPKTLHKAQLIGMYVRESCRGRGLGRQLVDAAVACARQRQGVSVIMLTVTDGNGPAIALYEAAGFRAFGTEPMAIRIGAGYKAKVHMWLDLAAGAAAA